MQSVIRNEQRGERLGTRKVRWSPDLIKDGSLRIPPDGEKNICKEDIVCI
jgi:hypothetical protein